MFGRGTGDCLVAVMFQINDPLLQARLSFLTGVNLRPLCSYTLPWGIVYIDVVSAGLGKAM